MEDACNQHILALLGDARASWSGGRFMHTARKCSSGQPSLLSAFMGQSIQGPEQCLPIGRQLRDDLAVSPRRHALYTW